MGLEGLESTTPAAAVAVFGDRVRQAERYVELLRRHGVERGLIGPREVDRLWDRHVLNSAVIGEEVPRDARVIDVGSGAGLPGVPLALSRPDLAMVLLEPMARRVDWLTEVAETLALAVDIERGRAEEKRVRARLGLADVVIARAVAPLARLAAWCLPLVRPGGRLVALKGASAADEIERDRGAIRKAGGGEPTLTTCGEDLLETPTTVVVIEREEPGKAGPSSRWRPGSRAR
ncbi:16S rRNA (guanine(527)-N(7))-methyltransferase RsmG [Prauserella muralis]|uniref:Ribosomal RNA small subunit methyltransferase G n=1 Tax=Prauserella muralis TaxID=588067 RepID=A0A2V4B8S8_9PSEU|nr:16S rRNA (guanine(527)-N(7))-methyltransferase RsmG [Prauserella muralis]PXY31667.1 16S rRNA (guanine(527)-N(7))-methyltransferase [Prauserella muralis]TWE13959.1 16S rRNA m(7)G-527 methyltransferase [Prauserella muralis]